jgi:molybdopterin molybdotransferase
MQERISLAQAQQIIAAAMAGWQLPVERVACEDALGRVLAQSLTAAFDLPSFDNASMDGYALRCSDLLANNRLQLQDQRFAELRSQTQAAAPPITQRLAAGQCIQVATGAKLPLGADAVVMVENARKHDLADGCWIEVLKAPILGENIRRQGADFAAGSAILSARHVIGPAQIAIAAAFNCSELRVFQKPRVSVLVSGNELLEQGGNTRLGDLANGALYDSNRPMLQALLAADGAIAKLCPILPDDPDAIREQLEICAATSDIILTAGGASVGERDHLPALIRSLGIVHFYRVLMKPGMPALFGEIDGKPVLCLPGNPASVFVTYLMLAKPLIQQIAGRDPGVPASFAVPLAAPIEKSHSRAEFLRARLQTGSDRTQQVVALSGQVSSMLHSLALADGLVALPEAPCQLAAGDMVRFLPFSGLLT